MSHSFSVIGLGFGDEGKGATVDYLCRKYPVSMVIRFNGGPQAAHNVVEPSGRWHCFSQFGSGTFVKGVRTHLAQPVLIEPFNLLNENTALKQKGITDALERLTVDPFCRVILPYNKMIGQLEELCRGIKKLGTVGMGVGDTVSDSRKGSEFVLTIKDLGDPCILKQKVNLISEIKFQKASELVKNQDNSEIKRIYQYFKSYSPENLINDLNQFYQLIKNNIKEDHLIFKGITQNNETIVFEGAQGTLLDKDFGFKPYITKTTTITRAIDDLLQIYKIEIPICHIGVVRAFAHRHGPGPMVTEEDELKATLVGEHNCLNPWQGAFRVGWFDNVLFRYALCLNKIDQVYMTCLDRLIGKQNLRICNSYKTDNQIIKSIDNTIATEMLMNARPYEWVEMQGWGNDLNDKNLNEYLNKISTLANINIRNISFGPTYLDRRDLE